MCFYFVFRRICYCFFLLFTVTDDKLPLYHKWLLFDPNQTSLKVQMVFRPDLDSYKAKQLRNP